MNIKRDYYYRTYKKEIRGAFSEKGRERLLVKLIDATILFNKNKFEKTCKTGLILSAVALGCSFISSLLGVLLMM